MLKVGLAWVESGLLQQQETGMLQVSGGQNVNQEKTAGEWHCAWADTCDIAYREGVLVTLLLL